MATAGSDRGIALYDLRTSTPIRKLIMQTKTNSIAWNPMEAFNFTAANEDCCLYTYDMRKLQSATCVHKDFVSAVMDVDYSPTGREFVAGSYDRSVRIFSHNGGHSKEVYHTKRMQRIFAVRFSGDGSYVFSGSDDMNVRLWKVCCLSPPAFFFGQCVKPESANRVHELGGSSYCLGDICRDGSVSMHTLGFNVLDAVLHFAACQYQSCIATEHADMVLRITLCSSEGRAVIA